MIIINQYRFASGGGGGGTNLFGAPSEDFTTWNLNRATVTANALTAPDGTTTAEKIKPNTASHDQHGIGFLTISTVNTTGYSIYVHAKAGEYNYLRVAMFNGAFTVAYGDVVFNLTTGAVHNHIEGGSGIIDAAANGYYRCGFSFTAAATESAAQIYTNVIGNTGSHTTAYSGNDSDGLYIWGAQLNTGSSFQTYQKIP